MDENSVMVWLFVLLFFLILPIIYVIFAPLYLEINTRTGLFRFRVYPVASAWAVLDGENAYVQWRLLFWSRRKNLSDIKAKRNMGLQKREKPVVAQKKTRNRNSPSFSKILAMLRSFQVPVCKVNVDTGNMALNGILFPLFWGLGYKTKKDITINFQGTVEIEMVLKNRVSRILWAYLSS